MEVYVFRAIGKCATMTTAFDLWMLRSSYDTFVWVINFINQSWVPCHIIVELFEAFDTSDATLAEQMKYLLVEFNLTSKVITYVKDEGANLISFTTTLTCVVSCEPLQLLQLFASFRFGHVMSKACQYATNETKAGVGMKEINLKDVQVVI
jgi:hypothetical protein